MKSNINENIKDNLLDLLKELENDLCSLLHNIETDETVAKETYSSIDTQSEGLFYIITQLKESILFS